MAGGSSQRHKCEIHGYTVLPGGCAGQGYPTPAALGGMSVQTQSAPPPAAQSAPEPPAEGVTQKKAKKP